MIRDCEEVKTAIARHRIDTPHIPEHIAIAWFAPVSDPRAVPVLIMVEIFNRCVCDDINNLCHPHNAASGEWRSESAFMVQESTP